MLSRLLTDRIKETGELIATPEALREWLAVQPEVRETVDDLRSGALTESDVGDCIDKLTNYFQRGTRFPWDVALAALSVSVERIPGDFYERFLRDLSEVRIQEMPMAPKVAAACLSERALMSRTDFLHAKMKKGHAKVTLRHPMHVIPMRDVPSHSELSTEVFADVT